MALGDSKAAVALATGLIILLSGVQPVTVAATPHEPLTNASVYFEDVPQPGATDVTMWSSTVAQNPDEYAGETYAGNFSIVWTPLIASGCQLENIETFGIDRGNDDPGIETDESAVPYAGNGSSFETGVDEYQEELSTTDWSYVEKATIDWNDPNGTFTQTIELEGGDQFIVEQSECYSLPEEAGWYRDRQRSIGVISSRSPSERFTQTFYSHWYYICDCESYDAAVERLGPPPSRAAPTTPVDTPREGQGETTPVETPTPTPNPTSTPTSVETTETASTPATTVPATTRATAPPVTATGTETSQPGFGLVLGVVALSVAALLWRDRPRP